MLADPLRSSRGTPGRLVAGAMLALVAGCATAPERVDSLARSYGYERVVVAGAGFRHVVYRSGEHQSTGALHVYLEGDGRPYLDRWTVATDPTPRKPLMLQLMSLDPADAIYVGRPCYFGLASEPPCSPRDWTLDRFSERVVTSLAAVIDAERVARGADAVELYGHSGGGALAVLLAHRIPQVTRVITLAGNLDTEAWVKLHHYSAMTGSLNPVLAGPLPASVSQQHYVGAADRVIPGWMVEEAGRRIGATAIVQTGMSHTCCWAERWPAILAGQPTD